MKKTVIGILAPIIALFLVTTSVLAAGNGNGKNYVDSDGDGVCDNRYGNSRGNGMGGCRNR